MNDFVRCIRGWAVFACLITSAWTLHAQMPHGDHNPHHGGVVLMFGADLHYEVMLSRDGKVQLWLSDAARQDLPAATVSDVAAEIERGANQRETVDMSIGDTGESWEGHATAVHEEGTVLHLAFVFRDEPAVVSFPASALMGAGRDKLVKESAHDAATSNDSSKAQAQSAHAGHEMHGAANGAMNGQ